MFYNFYGVYTLARREVRRFTKIYLQTIFAPLLNNMMFLAIFGAWTSSGQIARWLELVLLLLAAIANGRLAVRSRHYYEREVES